MGKRPRTGDDPLSIRPLSAIDGREIADPEDGGPIAELFVQMAEGATYSVVPFINKRSLGAVSGIVGAGGNVGAVLYAQFLLMSGAPLEDCFMYYGVAVAVIGLLGFGVRFSEAAEEDARQAFASSAASARRAYESTTASAAT